MFLVGDRSYAFYLWHWPVLVLAGAFAGHALSVPVKLGFVTGAFALACLSYALVENPIRHRVRSRRTTGLVIALCMAAFLGTSAVSGRDQSGGAALRRLLDGGTGRRAHRRPWHKHGDRGTTRRRRRRRRRAAGRSHPRPPDPADRRARGSSARIRRAEPMHRARRQPADCDESLPHRRRLRQETDRADGRFTRVDVAARGGRDGAARPLGGGAPVAARLYPRQVGRPPKATQTAKLGTAGRSGKSAGSVRTSRS